MQENLIPKFITHYIQWLEGTLGAQECKELAALVMGELDNSTRGSLKDEFLKQLESILSPETYQMALTSFSDFKQYVQRKDDSVDPEKLLDKKLISKLKQAITKQVNLQNSFQLDIEIKKALNADNELIREQATLTLSKTLPSVVIALSERLRDKSQNIRQVAAQSLIPHISDCNQNFILNQFGQRLLDENDQGVLIILIDCISLILEGLNTQDISMLLPVAVAYSRISELQQVSNPLLKYKAKQWLNSHKAMIRIQFIQCIKTHLTSSQAQTLAFQFILKTFQRHFIPPPLDYHFKRGLDLKDMKKMNRILEAVLHERWAS